MRLRTFAGILFALAVVVTVAYLSNQNESLMTTPFALSPTVSVPLYGALVAVFLAGFIPAVSILLVQSLKQGLTQRRERRKEREAQSLSGSFRRAMDFRADGQWAKAAAEFEILQAHKPEDFGTLLYYGEALRELGRPDEAIEVHRRLSVLYPQGGSVLYQLASDYKSSNQPEVADQIYDRILRDFPDQALTILRRKRDAALADKDWESAGRLQDRAETLLVDGGGKLTEREVQLIDGLHYQRCVELLGAERFQEARRELETLLKDRPEFLPAQILVGEALLAEGKEDAAVEAWRASFHSSGSPVVLQRIEDHFIERGNPVLAIETLHELISECDSALLPRFFLGRLYYRLEMHDEAFRVLGGIEDRVRSSPTYHYLMGRIHERRGEVELATRAFRTSLQEAGVREAEYLCASCGARAEEWADRCEACGAWNALALDFEEESVSAEDLGIRDRPVWAVEDDLSGL